MNEKTILSKVNHDFIIRCVLSSLVLTDTNRLFYTFQDTQYLYMCMELAPGGELLRLILHHKELQVSLGKTDRACSLDMAQFYATEIVEALEYLHSQGIIHRDMKPENVLITSSGHLKVTDFGTALQVSDESMSRSSFVGTAEYVSPEVFSTLKYSCIDLFRCCTMKMHLRRQICGHSGALSSKCLLELLPFNLPQNTLHFKPSPSIATERVPSQYLRGWMMHQGILC